MPTRNMVGARITSGANTLPWLDGTGKTVFDTTDRLAIAAWVRFTLNIDVFSHYNSVNNGDGYNLRIAAPTTTDGGFAALNISTGTTTTTTRTPIKSGQRWRSPMHVMCVLRANSNCEWYVNGELIAVTIAPGLPTVAGTRLTKIGSSSSGPRAQSDLYDVRVWAGAHVDIITGSGSAEAIMHGKPYGETGRYLTGGLSGLDASGRGNNLNWSGSAGVGIATALPNIAPDMRERRRRALSYRSPSTPLAVTPLAAVATWTALPGALAVGAVAVAPPAAVASWVVPTPAIAVGAVAVAPLPAISTWSALPGAIAVGAVAVAPASAVAAWNALPGTLALGAAAVAPTPAVAQWTALPPTLGNAPINVAPPAAVSSWVVPVPVIAVGAVSVAPLPAVRTWSALSGTLALGPIAVAPPAAVALWLALAPSFSAAARVRILRVDASALRTGPRARALSTGARLTDYSHDGATLNVD